MNNRTMIFLLVFSSFFLIWISKPAFSIPPLPVHTTSISPPPNNLATPEKVLEINFTVNSTSGINLMSIGIKNLPQAVVSTNSNDYYLEITDSNNKVLFHSNILVILDPNTGLSPQYYAIPYPSGARFLNFYYKNAKIVQYDVPQELPTVYIILGIAAVVVLAVIIFVVYYVRKNYTLQT